MPSSRFIISPSTRSYSFQEFSTADLFAAGQRSFEIREDWTLFLVRRRRLLQFLLHSVCPNKLIILRAALVKVNSFANTISANFFIPSATLVQCWPLENHRLTWHPSITVGHHRSRVASSSAASTITRTIILILRGSDYSGRGGVNKVNLKSEKTINFCF